MKFTQGPQIMLAICMLGMVPGCAPNLPGGDQPFACDAPTSNDGLPSGTAGIGYTPRMWYSDSNTTVQTISAELAAVVARFQLVHPAAQVLLQEPPVLPLVEVAQPTVSAWYGQHAENTDGSFSAVLDSTPRIRITLRNGIDIEFTFNTVQMGPSFTAAGRLDNFKLRVLANQRGLETPQAQQVDIDLQYDRMELPVFARTKFQPGIVTQGYIEYARPTPLGLEMVKYQLDRRLGAGGFADGLQVQEGQVIRLTDLSSAGAGKEWLSEGITSYVNPVISGAWVAEYASQYFSDGRLTHSALILSKSVADYVMHSRVELIGLGSMSFALSSGPITVAKVQGGPFLCDFSSTPAQGTGEALSLLWGDCLTQKLVPTPQFNCASLIVP